MGHMKHDFATFNNTQLDKQLVKRIDCNEYTISISIGELTIYNVYKRSLCKWNDPVLLSCHHPWIYIEVSTLIVPRGATQVRTNMVRCL